MLRFLTLALICVLASGCTTFNYTKQGVSYEEKVGKIKTISVMPIDFKVIQFSAGGVQEEMDEWASNAKEMIKDALSTNLAGRNIQLTVIDEDSIKAKHYEGWMSQKGMYQAIASSVLSHAYKGMGGFEDKINHFDYTFGEEFQGLSQATKADGILFIQGFDTERTTGKVVMDAFVQALAGVSYTYNNPLNMGLVDSQTGDLLWFKTNNMAQDVDFRNSKAVNNLIKWFMEDFLIKK